MSCLEYNIYNDFRLYDLLIVLVSHRDFLHSHAGRQLLALYLHKMEMSFDKKWT